MVAKAYMGRMSSLPLFSRAFTSHATTEQETPRMGVPGGFLLDEKGESAYSPFLDRREPLPKPVELPQGTLEMLILKAVSLGPLHGYGILLRIQQISGERLEILQGSFYTAIYRLENRGWIKGKWGESDNNRRARFYSLTAAGTRQLKAETAKWTDMAAVVAGILDTKADEI
jgi:PadR family transcriptional regulator, regulatory protein PadR